MEPGAVVGRVLRVDLATGQSQTERLDDETQTTLVEHHLEWAAAGLRAPAGVGGVAT